MRFDDLDSWLGWLEQLHPSEIDLGLGRTARVARRMGLDQPHVPVLTVAGTNGKGSVCAVLESVLDAAGYRVGRYTSPHLQRFNERIRIGSNDASDATICAALAAVDEARRDTSLTFFEFGTLAALECFRAAGADVWVLEVGLGGRLDATNVIDADVAVVTSIALDHAEWLGSDIDGIAGEKAGIARAGRPLIGGMARPPAGLIEAAERIGARYCGRGTGFDVQTSGREDQWCWSGFGEQRTDLPPPALAGGYQRDNAATALAALAAIGHLPPEDVVRAGISAARVGGRFECHQVDGVEVILDVAHNPAAAAALAQTLIARPATGATWAVFGIYRDKDPRGVSDALHDAVDRWIAVALPGPRGNGAEQTAEVLRSSGRTVHALASGPLAGYRAALEAARPGDRVVVLGSFATVAEVSGLFV